MYVLVVVFIYFFIYFVEQSYGYCYDILIYSASSLTINLEYEFIVAQLNSGGIYIYNFYFKKHFSRILLNLQP